MSLHAAQVFDCQIGRECRFWKFCLSSPQRGTKLNLSTNKELNVLPTKHLESERHFAGIRKFRDKRFTAKVIRNDCTLLISGSFHSKTENVFKKN